jgi:hypothetical protein
MKAYVQTGKYGDVASVLPILLHEFQTTGIKPSLVIAKQYADILQGVSYVGPVIFDGDMGDVRGAIKLAKRKFENVIVPQTHGRDYPVEHKTPSFQYSQWLRAGCVEHFEDWPLVFDQRSSLRERILIRSTVRCGRGASPSEKFILFADHSESSPFQQANELAKMLKDEFGSTHKIIRLSEVKASRIFDVLGLYDKADCLVTVETAHVHLSKASKVPTIVLAADGWRGSAWHPKFRFYCRYGEWERRKKRILFEMVDIIRGVKPAEITPCGTMFHNGYNLSAVRFGNRLIKSYRYHPAQNWKTKLVIDDGKRTLSLTLPEMYREYGQEDARLFVFNERLYAAYTLSTERSGRWFSVMGYGPVIEEKEQWRVEKHYQPKYGHNDFSGMEKNWCPFVVGGKLYFIYGIKDGKQIVLEVDRETVVAEHRSPAPTWPNGEIRGGAVLLRGDKLLRFFHSRKVYPDRSFRYFIGTCLMENRPPFATVKVVGRYLLCGDERYVHDCHHWKRNVVIPYGAFLDGDNILVAVGQNDCRSAIAEFRWEDLRL